MRTTIDVDKAAVEAASRVLGTKTLKETVNAALTEVIASARRRSLIERIEITHQPHRRFHAAG